MAANVKGTAQLRIYQEWAKTLIASREQAPAPTWKEFCVEVPSIGRSTLHTWFLNQAKVRKWTGKRVYNNLSSQNWQVWNDRYELSYEFDGDEIDDDIDGLIQNAVMSARSDGPKWAKHEDQLVATALEAGDSSLCHDGQNFFDDAHPYDVDGIGTSGTFDNDLQLALTPTNYQTAREVFLGMKGPDGYPINDPANIKLVVPVQLELTAMQILNQGNVTMAATIGVFGTGGPSPNLLAGTAKPVVNRYLTDATTWYLTGEDGILKPLMFQRRLPVQHDQEDRDSQIYRDEHKIRFGAWARHAVSYTLPQLAVRSKP